MVQFDWCQLMGLAVIFIVTLAVVLLASLNVLREALQLCCQGDDFGSESLAASFGILVVRAAFSSASRIWHYSTIDLDQMVSNWL